MMKKIAKFLPAALGAAVLAGCALKPLYISTPYAPPRKVVLLPFDNLSVDVNAPIVIRRSFSQELAKRGFDIYPQKAADDIMRTKLGYTDGGQIKSVFYPRTDALPDPKASSPEAKNSQPVNMEKIAAAFPDADAFVFGRVHDYKYQTILVYTNKLVAAGFKMVDRKGTPIWEDFRKAAKKQIATSAKEIKETVGADLAGKAIANAGEASRQQRESEGGGKGAGEGVANVAAFLGYKHPLADLTTQVVREAASTLPRN